ncbi:MAG TPA: DinB family protein [Blastocatellia bacterium]
MRKLTLALLVMLLAGAFLSTDAQQATTAAGDPHMTADERAKVVKWMNDTQKTYLDRLEHVSEAQWNWRPAPFRWTVGEIAEHIMLTESRLFAAVETAMAAPANPDWQTRTRGKDAFIERAVPNRGVRVQAPIEIRPTGKLSRDEVVRRYKELRARALEFARTTDAPLKAHTVEHPFPIFNTLNAYDWLIYIPLHNERHNQQMAEVMAAPGYPK